MAEKISRRKIWRKRAFHLLLFMVLIAGIRTWQQRDMVSGAAPLLQGALLSGSAYALPARPAQPVLVHFWATWCPVCRAEQGTIAAIAQDRPDTITVAMQSGSDAEVAMHLAEQGLRFPVLNDPDGRLSSAWGVHAVPASFIIGPDGQIRFIEVGYTTALGLRFRLWLAGVAGLS
ncbi:MAG: alkyl hydroperoxide reductase [Betaproteobacteria bacterium RBG_16_56_24]|nr:MAG: alkyl hydroperoxide reductase [Betaproteobacteria bacterium RBG_16_56_24]